MVKTITIFVPEIPPATVRRRIDMAAQLVRENSQSATSVALLVVDLLGLEVSSYMTLAAGSKALDAARPADEAWFQGAFSEWMKSIYSLLPKEQDALPGSQPLLGP